VAEKKKKKWIKSSTAGQSGGMERPGPSGASIKPHAAAMSPHQVRAAKRYSAKSVKRG
jgi:hypothetical protein